MLVRPEEEKDYAAVHEVNIAAFETPAEANLVDALRKEAHPLVSLVAELDGKAVGHILFSPVTLSGNPKAKIMGLAPMAVVPGMQDQGIGTVLVQAGLEQCKVLGYGAVIVLGYPNYYPRFGFVPATRFGIGCEYDVPEEVFMALELESGDLRGLAGTIRYHPAFENV